MCYVSIHETYDGEYLVAVNGFQWAPAPAVPDSSGAYYQVWPTREEAKAAWLSSPDSKGGFVLEGIDGEEEAA